jgi:GTP cyclohydrolase I
MTKRIPKVDRGAVEKAVADLLLALGQDLTREGLKDTPVRVANSFIEQCTPEDPELHRVFNEERYDELVMVKNIPFMSFCEHHLLPFWGVAHVAYLPGEKLLGISKLARLVSARSRGFQIQERITRDIADELMEEIQPYGVMVVIEATHACISLRGAKALGSSTVSSAVRGLFKDSPTARGECLDLIRKP